MKGHESMRRTISHLSDDQEECLRSLVQKKDTLACCGESFTILAILKMQRRLGGSLYNQL